MSFPHSVRIHSTAEVEPGATLGPHTVVWRFVHIMAGAHVGAHCSLGQGCFVGPRVRIGDHCRIQNNVSLYEGVVLGDYVFVGPSAVFTNVKRPRAAHPTAPEQYVATHVEDGASIGANATLVGGVHIGRGAMIGAGAVVTKSVLAHTLVVGAPARPCAGVCACGHPLEVIGQRGVCTACGLGYTYEIATGWVPFRMR